MSLAAGGQGVLLVSAVAGGFLGMGRKVEEELIVELSAAAITPRDALWWARSRLKIDRTRLSRPEADGREIRLVTVAVRPGTPGGLEMVSGR